MEKNLTANKSSEEYITDEERRQLLSAFLGRSTYPELHRTSGGNLSSAQICMGTYSERQAHRGRKVQNR